MQEIIKVRERVPHVGLKPKAIPLNLFLNVVPSLARMLLARCVDSPSDFLATSWDDLAGNVAKRHFICFWFSLHRCFLHSKSSFCCAFLCVVLVWLFILFSSFGFREFNKQTTHDGNLNEWLCSLRYNPLFISLPFFTKQQREIGTFCVWRCLTYSVWNIYDSDIHTEWI